MRHIARELHSLGQGAGMHAFPQRWLPSAFAILEEGFTEENHFLNSTLKIVRGKITDHYMERIQYLYTPDGKNPENPFNLQAMEKLLGSS